MENINEVREYFADNHGHIDLDQLTDDFILGFMARDYLEGSSFHMKMYCLYDHVLAQGLCDIVE
jgi:hypothetical protein